MVSLAPDGSTSEQVSAHFRQLGISLRRDLEKTLDAMKGMDDV